MHRFARFLGFLCLVCKFRSRIHTARGEIRRSDAVIHCPFCSGGRVGSSLDTAIDLVQLFLGDAVPVDLLDLCLQLIPHGKGRICGRVCVDVCAVADRLFAPCPGGWYDQCPILAEAFHTQVQILPRLHHLMGYNCGSVYIQDRPHRSLIRSPGTASANQIFGKPIPCFVIFDRDRKSHHPGGQRSGYLSPCLCPNDCQFDTCQIQPFLFVM